MLLWPFEYKMWTSVIMKEELFNQVMYMLELMSMTF
jgi:hypothetical protein